jgi:CheY-like chemotaxis protein
MAPSVAPPLPVQPLRVLLVDDDPLVLASAAGMLEEMGHAVTEASSGPQALAQVREGPPLDLVLTDYGMPGMSGAELAVALARLRPGLPVILATGYGEVPGGVPAGVTPLGKPFGQEALAAAIAAARAPPG